MMMMKTDRLIDSYNLPEGNQRIDRHEGNPHSPTALLVLPFVISLNVIFLVFFPLILTLLFTLSAVGIIKTSLGFVSTLEPSSGFNGVW